MSGFGSWPGEGDEAQGGSPRGFLSSITALDYYDVLARVKPAASDDEDGDEYQQVDFEDARSEALRNGRLSGARRHSMERFQAARTRIQSIAPGAFIANKLRAKLHWTPRRVVLRDKLTFTLGVAHIMVSMYWLGYSPSTFYQLYTVKAGLLMPLRFVLYKRDKMHYYLLDFCYYANLLLILQAWALPEWCLLEKALFSFATGPLAWSIILFRNSMIFHSLDKMTSLFVHAFPPVVVWTQRWYPGDPKHWKTIAKASCDAKDATLFELVLIPWIPYAIWAVVYYLKIFVISSERIQERGYHTLFKYVVRKPTSFLGQLNAALPRWAAPIVYMFWHVGFCAITFLLAWICWHNYWVHSGFLISMVMTSAWNGGNFYFDVFAHRYLEDMGIPTRKPRSSAQDADLQRRSSAPQSSIVDSEADLRVVAAVVDALEDELAGSMQGRGVTSATAGVASGADALQRPLSCSAALDVQAHERDAPSKAGLPPPDQTAGAPGGEGLDASPFAEGLSHRKQQATRHVT